MKKKRDKKKQWKKMEITKLALNPEQAVLSCCDAVRKVALWTVFGTQCETAAGAGCWGTEGETASS